MTRVAVVGGGILGMTLAWRLAQRGVEVELIEAAPHLGGLSCSHDYGEFVWDRFYHCILPSDARLLGLLDELGLSDELHWTRTRTGLYSGGRCHPASGSLELLRLPMLGWLDKLRLGWCSLVAGRMQRPDALRTRTAAEWLTAVCGRRAYEVFWQPLLRAKFGPYHDAVAATFIQATIKRLMRARSGAAKAEHLGYVSGGYARVIARLEERLRARSGRVSTGTRLIGLEERGEQGCRLELRTAAGERAEREYAQVFVTTPTRTLAPLARGECARYVARLERDYPTAAVYLGVITCNLVLEAPLTPYYVLNIADAQVELTGVIEMTNLIDARTQTAGRSLVYLPRYLASDAPEFQASDEALRASFLDRGLRRLFPDAGGLRSASIQRASLVQALPLASQGASAAPPLAQWRAPMTVLNTSMLDCSTLNNDEVVGLVDDFVERHAAPLSRLRARDGRFIQTPSS